MAVHNLDIAKLFNDVADLLDIQGANRFRVRAYRSAALTIGTMSGSIADMVNAGGDITGLPGIGKDLASKIEEIVKTGSLGMLKELEKTLPAGLIELTTLPTLGPRRAKLLYDALGIKSLEELNKAALQGKVHSLPGFGLKTEQTILEELDRRNKSGVQGRIKLAVAEQLCEPLLDYLRGMEGVSAVVAAGSYRRRKETVADLDILATCANHPALLDRLSRYDEADHVISRGETLSSIWLRSGIRVDVRVVGESSYGAALVYFTGSKTHNVAIRKIGVARGLKINEYGVFRGDRRVAGKSEADVYGQIGLNYIEPELREDTGEVEAARRGELPDLVSLDDIRGDLQSHTSATDGLYSLEEMAAAARSKGYEYLAITDHSKQVRVAHGMDEKRLAGEIRAIDKLNGTMKRFRLLKSVEVDILEDGSLDLPNAILKELDFTVCSIHYHFNLSREKQTERVLRAMDNPCFNIMAHPTGRLIGRREPYDIDLERVMRGARARGCFFEINSQPDRLDLSDIHARMASEMGIRIAISTDAHSLADLDYMRFGVAQARRAWLESDDVLNTRSWQELSGLLRR